MIGGLIVINYQSPATSLKNLSLLRVIKTENPALPSGEAGFFEIAALS
jgi:hypothetical protein